MNSITTITTNSSIDILFFTFNRLYYTQKTLPDLLESSDMVSYQIIIVDNGSTDGTVEYLQKLNHPRIKKVIYARGVENIPQKLLPFLGKNCHFWRKRSTFNVQDAL